MNEKLTKKWLIHNCSLVSVTGKGSCDQSLFSQFFVTSFSINFWIPLSRWEVTRSSKWNPKAPWSSWRQSWIPEQNSSVSCARPPAPAEASVTLHATLHATNANRDSPRHQHWPVPGDAPKIWVSHLIISLQKQWTPAHHRAHPDGRDCVKWYLTQVPFC